MKLRRLSAAALLAQPSFPRISPDEELVIRDFVLQCGGAYDCFSVDVPIGRRFDGVESPGDVFDRAWASITRRRIDLLAFHVLGIDVVEAKVYATLRAATQVRTYCEDLQREQPLVRGVRPVIVCRAATPGLAVLMLQIGGRLIEVPDGAPMPGARSVM